MSRNFFGIEIESPLVSVKQYLSDGQELQFGHSSLHVLHTPGHTPGGLCFYQPDAKALFSGDTLFQGSIGRTDFPGGSLQALVDGIRTKILTLPDDVAVYPGHGPSTTVGYERQYNPYI
jgi:glyoxylase-like metal-dependent hydrolase (beta-lactamase superfamily II)